LFYKLLNSLGYGNHHLDIHQNVDAYSSHSNYVS
jgi:hypothetical protein